MGSLWPYKITCEHPGCPTTFVIRKAGDTDQARRSGWYHCLVNPEPGKPYGTRCPKHVDSTEAPQSALVFHK